MAIQIDNWNNISGKCTIDQKGKEFELNFFMDENHGKIMLGLKKGSDGKKENYMDEVRKITLYKNKCTEWKKIMAMFAEAFNKIDIEIRSDAE